MLGDAEVAELTALRRRAYSADADIARDPAAMARLDELERAVLPLPPRPTPGGSRGRGGAGADGVGAGGAGADAGQDSAGADAGPDDAGSGGAGADGVRSSPGPTGDAKPDAVPDAVPDGADTLNDRRDSPRISGDDGSASREQGGAPDPFDIPDPAAVEASHPVPVIRRTWPARAVVVAAVPAAVVLIAFGFVFGGGTATPATAPTPSPTHTSVPPRPGFADSYAWARSVRTWDVESLRVLAMIDGTRVWAGTVGSGAATCVAIDDQRTDPVVCRVTTDVARDGIVVDAPRARDDNTPAVLYVVNPYGEPTVTMERIVTDGAD